MKQATQRLPEEKTFVLWDINGCPIPDGFDPRLVRRRIESALKKSGYSRRGPLTITAIGDLIQTPGDEVLRELSSTGISLQHSHDIVWGLYGWTYHNPSPATVMLISGHSQLRRLAPTLESVEQRGYTTLLAYLQDPAPDELLKSYLNGDIDDDKQEETATTLVLPGESPWTCSVCFYAAQSVEDFTTHLKSVKHAYSEWDLVGSYKGVNKLFVKPEPPNNDPDTIKEWDLLYNADIECCKNLMKGEDKTLVLWHINSCRIPNGYDPRLVRPRIESALKTSGCSGSLTISAIGNPSDAKVLRELSSTGIALKHAHEVEADLLEWTHDNPSSATIMLISGPSQLECLFPTLHYLYFDGYTFLLAYPQRDPAPDWLWKCIPVIVQKEWLWKSLLEGEMD